MSRPDRALAAAQRLLEGDAWELLRGSEGTSLLQQAWTAHVAALVPGCEAQDAAFGAAHHEWNCGIRAGLLFGALVAGRPDGASPTAADAAAALISAAGWLDSDAVADDWPEQAGPEEWPEGMVVPKMNDEERDERQAVVDMLRATHRAAEVGVVGDATGAATDLWRALNGVDLATATVEQMIDLGASQQAAILQGRAQLEQILDARPEWAR